MHEGARPAAASFPHDRQLSGLISQGGCPLVARRTPAIPALPSILPAPLHWRCKLTHARARSLPSRLASRSAHRRRLFARQQHRKWSQRLSGSQALPGNSSGAAWPPPPPCGPSPALGHRVSRKLPCAPPWAAAGQPQHLCCRCRCRHCCCRRSDQPSHPLLRSADSMPVRPQTTHSAGFWQASQRAVANARCGAAGIVLPQHMRWCVRLGGQSPSAASAYYVCAIGVPTQQPLTRTRTNPPLRPAGRQQQRRRGGRSPA